MSSLEDLSMKYLDELSDFIPLPCLASFILGVLVIAGSASSAESGVWNLLSRNYGDYWFFRDIIFRVEIWKLLALVVISSLGTVCVKRVSKAFVSAGLRLAGAEVERVYKRALDLANKGEFPKNFVDAASKWKEKRFASVWLNFKAASFFFSLGGIELFVLALSFRWHDLLASVLFISIAVGLSWVFSKKYFVAYLPERILHDASIGLISPRVSEDM
jgi:hypothetical protein